MIRLHTILLFCVAVVCVGLQTAAQPPNVTVKVSVGKKNFIGKILAFDDTTMVLLRRSGRMTMIPRNRIDSAKTISKGFKSLDKDLIRAQLQREFGNKYQVSMTSHFVVVHPPGDFQDWAMPFEKLYVRYRNYFSSRGINLDDPEFPMVAVVLRTRDEFDRFLKNYHELDKHILGYYSPNSNRIITYDQTGGNSKGGDWLFNVDTVVHEATHQAAFNTGLHTRFAPNPRWISEGLATMFEAPGVQNSMYYSSQRDRINYGRLADLKALYNADGVNPKIIASMVASDEIFRSSPGAAYALAWGLTFYLAEKQPDKYISFLKADGAREDFHEFSSRDRITAFMKKFGKITELEPRMKKFIMSLPDKQQQQKVVKRN